VHALLFLATVFATLCIGAKLQYNFEHNLGSFAGDDGFWPWSWVLEDWHRLAMGIPFSACLLGILTAHEFGHYIYCVRRGVYATLPYFIPAPTLVGTMGAFIRIRSPIRTRADLFDIGIAGPIAGFLVALPVLFYSLMGAKPLTGDAADNGLMLGLPLVFKIAHWILAAFGNSVATQFPVNGLYLPPTAIAAWFGMFATALNLIPGGQLDGGHIIFALRPRLHRPVSFVCIAAMMVMSWQLWIGWLLWAVILRMTGERHPDVPHYPEPGKKRWILGAVALAMLAVTFISDPFPKHTQQDASTVHDLLENFRNERLNKQQPPAQQTPQQPSR
jgi:membrane-associated protease RseP (regulator of RpoE activity)